MRDITFTILAWVLTLPLLAATIAFALFHQESVSLLYNPFGDAATVPLFLPVLIALVLGFLFGALMTWAAAGRQRTKMRAQAKKIAALEKQIETKNVEAYKSHNTAPYSAALLEKRS